MYIWIMNFNFTRAQVDNLNVFIESILLFIFCLSPGGAVFIYDAMLDRVIMVPDCIYTECTIQLKCCKIIYRYIDI